MLGFSDKSPVPMTSSPSVPGIPEPPAQTDHRSGSFASARRYARTDRVSPEWWNEEAATAPTTPALPRAIRKVAAPAEKSPPNPDLGLLENEPVFVRLGIEGRPDRFGCSTVRAECAS